MFSQLIQKFGLSAPHVQEFLRFAAQYSPYYREQDWAKNLLVGFPIRLTDIPVTPKALVRAASDKFRSQYDPPEFGQVIEKHTSGSTGQPMPVFKAASHFRINAEENLRLRQNWNINQYATLLKVALPSLEKPLGTVEVMHGDFEQRVYKIYSRSADEIGALLRKTRAEVFSARPHIVTAILDDGNDYAHLRLVQCGTSVVPGELRNKVMALPDCRIIDIYGSVETGLIAISCPVCEKYHLAERNVFLEVLRSDGALAEEGELGRAIVTVHNNSAMPLIRYDLGDIVTFSQNSPCNPGKISLDKIYGRERMMFKLSSGEQIFPEVDPTEIYKLGIKRFKLVQPKPDVLEFRYLGNVHRPDMLQVDVETIIQRDLSPLFRVQLVEVAEFPLGPSGKYFMHERLFD